MTEKRAVNLAILVAALGYFVDIYDLILFSVVRQESLAAIGVPEGELLSVGLMLLARQNLGMLVGGILWGILGDRRGRLSVLFGSILLYSLANLANGLVSSVEGYAALRFVAGVGLAGELGAGITLVAELMHRESRGYGATLIATVGVLGAVAAEAVARSFDWRTAYMVGGVLGLGLLALRIGVRESPMFTAVRSTTVTRGNFLALFSTRARVIRYLALVLIGVPIWYVVGILVSFAPEFVRAMGLDFSPSPGRAIAFLYIGLAAGDLGSGLFSQLIRSRRRAIGLWLGFSAIGCAAFFLEVATTLAGFYLFCAGLGFAIGYWAVFMMVAAEQFGTNLRSTAATTAPNFVRGAVVPMAWGFSQLRDRLGVVGAGLAVGVVVFLLAVVALAGTEETFGKDLDYVET